MYTISTLSTLSTLFNSISVYDRKLPMSYLVVSVFDSILLLPIISIFLFPYLVFKFFYFEFELYLIVHNFFRDFDSEDDALKAVDNNPLTFFVLTYFLVSL